MKGAPLLRGRAYAKINIGLEVLGRRADGFHELRTILQTIDFYEDLDFAPADEPGIHLTCDDKTLSTGSDNLICRAGRTLAEQAGITPKASIRLLKRIPWGRGLGGGSADAALTLLALNRLWETRASTEDLHEVAETLGMDVPFFLYGGTALAVGRGEEVYPLGRELDLPIVLILPDFAIETARAYGRLMLTNPRPRLKLLPFAWRDPADRNALSGFINDLEGATGEHFSSIREFKKLLLELGASEASMSGSGSAVYGLFRDGADAEKAAQSLRGKGIRAVLSRTLRREAYWRERLREED